MIWNSGSPCFLVKVCLPQLSFADLSGIGERAHLRPYAVKKVCRYRAAMKHGKLTLTVSLLLLAISSGWAQQRRKVIINQDCSGPGGSNLQTLLVMIQSPQVEVLGITVVSGDQW